VRSAIAVANGGGAHALTMAAVAGRLWSYSAMALYHYVPSKDGLDGIAARLRRQRRQDRP